MRNVSRDFEVSVKGTEMVFYGIMAFNLVIPFLDI